MGRRHPSSLLRLRPVVAGLLLWAASAAARWFALALPVLTLAPACEPGERLAGWVTSDAAGRLELRTIRPGGVWRAELRLVPE